MVNDKFELIEMLAATLAHEVKNPLTLLRANIDYIELCDTDKRHMKNYNIMKSQLEKTNSILNNFVWLLQSSQSQDTKVDVTERVFSVVNDYSNMPNLEFKLNIEEGLLTDGNVNMISIVFSNIIKNSIEAQAGKIKIDAWSEDGDIKIIFHDDGQGIDEEAKLSIELEQPYTSKKYGNGIGALICRRAVLERGGTYEIKNSDEGGCVVSLSFPKM